VRIDGPVDTLTGAPTAAEREMSFLRGTRYARAVGMLRRGDSAAIASPPPGPPTSMFAMSLDALAALARGDSTRAIAQLRRAAELEARAPLIGPPAVLSPLEGLGAALLAAGQPHDAVAAYERALAHAPNRASALLGLVRARTASGDTAGAATARAQLLRNWHAADADVRRLAERAR
jgi:Flp pilus assembly protein TadD